MKSNITGSFQINHLHIEKYYLVNFNFIKQPINCTRQIIFVLIICLKLIIVFNLFSFINFYYYLFYCCDFVITAS